MEFQIGKTYQHSGGRAMKIVGSLKTRMWGDCLVGEENDGTLIPVGSTTDHAVNWKEVPNGTKSRANKRKINNKTPNKY